MRKTKLAVTSLRYATFYPIAPLLTISNKRIPCNFQFLRVVTTRPTVTATSLAFFGIAVTACRPLHQMIAWWLQRPTALQYRLVLSHHAAREQTTTSVYTSITGSTPNLLSRCTSARRLTGLLLDASRELCAILPLTDSQISPVSGDIWARLQFISFLLLSWRRVRKRPSWRWAWACLELSTTPCLKKLGKNIFVRTSSNFHQHW